MTTRLPFILTRFCARNDGNPEPPLARDAPTLEELEEEDEARENGNAEPVPYGYPVVDLESKAARATYYNGKSKRSRFRRVKLASRRVVIMLHQMGVVRSPGSSRWPLVTAHRVIGPDGTRMRLHPLDVRLVAGNRIDRAPYHGIHIEIAGNFEGVEGSGQWWNGDVFGRSRLNKAQELATLQELRSIQAELSIDYSADVWAIMPHRVTGQSDGKPNRPICPGSAVWSRIGERFAAESGIPVPSSTYKLGGLPIDPSWHGRFHELAELVLMPDGTTRVRGSRYQERRE